MVTLLLCVDREMLAMKQQSWRFITLIIICITVVMVVLITRKDLCEVRLKSGQTEVAVFTAYESE